MSKMSAINKYRAERWCYLHGLKALAWLIRSWIYFIHNSYIPYTCEIGEGTEFGYKGIGLVIHSNARIGKHCVIGTNVTIGGGAGRSNKAIPEFDPIRNIVPVLGDCVSVGTGAKILGPIVIGDDVIIGANAVVINDVPSKSVVGGGASKNIVYKNRFK